MKRLISFVLILCLAVLSLNYGQTGAAATKKPVPIQPSAEVKRAISYGFVPIEIQNNLETTITFSQYCSMISQMLTLYNKSTSPTFNKYAKLALNSKNPMKREDGMLTLYYAALSMNIGPSEDNFTNDDILWLKINAFIGDPWSDFSWNYSMFPNWDKKNAFGWNNVATAYFFSMGQYSRVSGKTLFDLDDKNKTMHVNKLFTRQDAINSVARLYESTEKFNPIERTKTQWDETFLETYYTRLNSILNSNTTIVRSDTYIPGKTYTGTAYYISPNGDDNNNGLTPDTPWATLQRTNSGQLRTGDAIFLERNGIWREELNCIDGVTYSAYGTGEKPCIYGSQENGADADKWTLWYQDKTGKKIWKFYKDMLDCGGIVFNDGASYANRVFSWWNGNKYVFLRNHNKTFDIKQGLEYNLQFYSTFDASKYKMPIPTYDIDTTGPLYLRCDAGNPGTLYKSIEFQTAPRPKAAYVGLVWAAEGCVIDSICTMYGISRGIGAFGKNNVLIQNCEVAWIGGGTHEITADYHPGSGEGIGIEGDNNTAKSNYVHDCWDGGIISEINVETPYIENQTIEGNIIERCMSGVLVASHRTDDLVNPAFGNFKINDNYIMYSGYGWSSDTHYDFGYTRSKQGGLSYIGNSITFWDFKPNINKGVLISNNVFYLAKSALIRHSMTKKYWPVMKGNTYVQNQYGVIGAWNLQMGTATKGSEKSKFIRDVMGDKTAKVIDISD